jgi:hypothetical protein
VEKEEMRTRFLGETFAKVQLKRQRWSWKNSVKLDLTGMGINSMDWIQMAKRELFQYY